MVLQKSERVTWIDIAKSIIIFLVVIGHTLRGGIVQQIIYSFHVTAFFVLSGMVCNTNSIKKQIKNDFLRIMIPYYIFGIISIAVFLIFGKFAGSSLEIDTNLSFSNNLFELLCASPKGGRMKFNTPLWFLPCLFATKIIYYLICKLCRGKQIAVLTGSMVISGLGYVLTALGVFGLPFNLAVSMKMLVFFSLGRIIFCEYQKHKYVISRYRSFILGITLIVITAFIASLAPKVNYSGDTFPNIAAFLLTSLLGTAGICFISMGISNCKLLEYIGKRTLAVLVMHKFPILLFQTVGPMKTLLTQNNSAIGVLVALLVSIITIFLCLTAELVIRRFLPFMLGDFSSISCRRYNSRSESSKSI